MGERALAVCPTGRDWTRDWAVYSSQWGGKGNILTRVLEQDSDPFGPLLEADWHNRGLASATTLFRTLDYLAFEAVYVLSYGVRTYYPLWLGLPHCGAVAPTDGLLVALGGVEHRSRLRRFLRRYKSLLVDGVESGLLTPARAQQCLDVVGRHCAGTAVIRATGR